MKKILLILLFLPNLIFSQSVISRGDSIVVRGDTVLTISFIPSDIDSMIYWLDANTISGVDGSVVGTWNDISSNGYDAVQGTGAYQPILKKSIINGQSVVRFDGSNDFLISNITNSYSQPITMFIVYTVSVEGQEVITSMTSTYYKYQIQYYDVTNWIYMSDDSYNITYARGDAPFTANGTYIFNGANSKTYENGVLKNSGTLLNSTFTGNFFVGASAYSGGSIFLNGDIAEIIVYNKKSFTTDLQQQVENYLSNKYGL